MAASKLTELDELIQEHQEIDEGFFKGGIPELDELAQAQNLRDWVAGEKGPPLEVLEHLEKALTYLRDTMTHHFHEENKGLIPYFRKAGQKEFANLLVSEHRKIGARLNRLLEKVCELPGKVLSEENLESEIAKVKEEFEAVLQIKEAHAGMEEKMLFLLGHGG